MRCSSAAFQNFNKIFKIAIADNIDMVIMFATIMIPRIWSAKSPNVAFAEGPL